MLAAVQGMPLVTFVAQWILVCLLAATISWALLMIFLRRRLRSLSIHRGPLFASLLLVAVAAANLYVVGRAFALHDPLVVAPAQALFLIFFYIYPNASYGGSGVRWLGVIYVFAQISVYVPQRQSNDQQALAMITQVHGLLGTLMVVGSVAALAPIMIGILPQLYARSRRLALLGFPDPMPAGRQVVLVAMVGIVGLVLLLGAGALTMGLSFPAIDVVRIAYFLLANLVPVAVGFALVNGRRYDYESLLHRALIELTVAACLLLVYGAGIVVMNLIFPGNSGSGSAYLPFVLLIGALLAAIYPLVRAQIETLIGRRFFHETYTAEQVLTAANMTWRGETRPDHLCAQVISAIEKALHPAAVALWVRQPPGAAGLRPSVVFASSASSLPRAGTSTPEAEFAPLSPDVTQLRLYPGVPNSTPTNAATLMLRPDDPAHGVFQRPASVVEVDRLPENSPIASGLRASAMRLALPLVSEGNLVGVLALTARPEARPYGCDVRELLVRLAALAAPALASARIAHQQEIEMRERERVEQELHTARRIQIALLPKATPDLAGWRLATYYQPAREVGGDFYDFIELGNGCLGIVLGDVTDKGIPAALVMATTRSMLRAVATQPARAPGLTLAQVNGLLCADLPPGMFVTCFYAILDPATGRLRYANAGQDLPYVRRADGSVSELWARGMPLGLMNGMAYEERETTLAPGDELLCYSDGLVEAHSPVREMFGFPRLMALLSGYSSSAPPIDFLLNELAGFTGPEWEQEDDITLLTLQRQQRSEGIEGEGSTMSDIASAGSDSGLAGAPADETVWRMLDEWTLASEPGNERQAIARVAQTVQGLGLTSQRLEDLKTAAGETTLNAMEHSHHYRPDLRVSIQVLASATALAVRISDEGGNVTIPEAQTPDLDAKLAGVQSPRGWGMYLIKRLVDELRVSGDGTHHTVELIMTLGATSGGLSHEQLPDSQHSLKHSQEAQEAHDA
jgi:serine phosphatase RsbU (regulator of sigma subunit)/anti-sigma regulatory factor (Ser/Thr protein kinase)